MKRQRHTREYKLEAVRLAKSTDKSIATVATELGVPVESLYRWKRELAAEGDEAFRGNGVLRSEEAEIARLRRELKRVTDERDFLKKRPRTLPRKAHEVCVRARPPRPL